MVFFFVPWALGGSEKESGLSLLGGQFSGAGVQ